jgi:hypothetical protein
MARLGQISALERRLLLEALVLLPRTALRLRLFGLRPDALGGSALAAAASPAGVDEIARQVARAVRRAARYGLWRGNCLSQSVTLWQLLRRHGVPCELYVGVRRDDDDPLSAHAWVEHDGQPLNERPGVRERFAAFERPLLVTPGPATARRS